MLKLKKGCLALADGIVFFREFLTHPHQVASIIPSSRFLERRIVELAGIASAETVVELGAGTGGTTRAILRAMAQHAKLLSIDINPQFHALLKRVPDGRLIAHLGGAYAMRDAVRQYGLPNPDVVISGIPFSTTTRRKGRGILEEISQLLAPGGRFVAYQIGNRVKSLCRPLLGAPKVSVELLNIPPLRVYRWEKTGARYLPSVNPTD